MRKLKLNRQKNFLGAALKLKIFIEDSNGKHKINNIACTLLGVLKNGQTGNYSIPTESKMILLSASMIFTQKRAFIYQVPEGDDIELFTAPTGDMQIPENRFGVWSWEEIEKLGLSDKW